MSEKIYCGSAKIISTQYGELTKISFTAEDVKTLENNLKNGWVNLVVKEKKEKKEGKPTHYLEVDTWEKKAETQQAIPVNDSQHAAKVVDDDLPF